MSGNVIPLVPRTSRDATPSTRSRLRSDESPQEVSVTHHTPAVYTVAETAELLSLSLGSTYTLVRSGQIPAKKMGGRWVVPKRRFHAWLDDLPEASDGDVERELQHLGNNRR